MPAFPILYTDRCYYVQSFLSAYPLYTWTLYRTNSNLTTNQGISGVEADIATPHGWVVGDSGDGRTYICIPSDSPTSIGFLIAAVRQSGPFSSHFDTVSYYFQVGDPWPGGSDGSFPPSGGGGGIVCSYGITPESIAVPYTSGSTVVDINSSDPSCVWTTHPNDGWLFGTYAGTGTQTREISWTRNDTGVQRVGTVSMAGITFTVTQDPTPVSHGYTPGDTFDLTCNGYTPGTPPLVETYTPGTGTQCPGYTPGTPPLNS